MPGANIYRCQESQKTIVINEFSTFKLFTMQNFVENGWPHSLFPIPRSHFYKDNQNLNILRAKRAYMVVITWSPFDGMKFRPIQPYDYKWKLNFVPARQDSFPPDICLDLYAIFLNFSL